jgi:hypothetical protein
MSTANCPHWRQCPVRPAAGLPRSLELMGGSGVHRTIATDCPSWRKYDSMRYS